MNRRQLLALLLLDNEFPFYEIFGHCRLGHFELSSWSLSHLVRCSLVPCFPFPVYDGIRPCELGSDFPPPCW